MRKIGYEQGPGLDYGVFPAVNNPQDLWYRTTPACDGWSYVYHQPDSMDASGLWTTGLTVKNIEWRDWSSQNDEYNYFFKEITIPWIKITWHNHGPIIYPFEDIDGSPTNGNLILTTSYYVNEGNNNCGCWNNGMWIAPQPTILHSVYSLIVDGGSSNNFEFAEEISLSEYGNQNNVVIGDITVGIQVLTATMFFQNWDNQQDWMDYIEFAFIVDPDIDGSTVNDVSLNDNGDFYQPVNEDGGHVSVLPLIPAPAQRYGAIMGDGSHAITLTINKAFLPTAADIWCLVSHGNEYSHEPSDYDDAELFDDSNPLLWYTMEFTQNNLPVGQNVPPIRFDIEGLTA